MEDDRDLANEQDGQLTTAESDVPASPAPTPRRCGRRLRSRHLTLVLISAAVAAGMTGCGRLESGSATQRDVYASMEDCQADWGRPDDCEMVDEGRSATGRKVWYGPRYSSRTHTSTGYSTTPRSGSRSKGTVSSTPTRGGFGASASRHGGGSSAS